jgi:hypothetical protein
VAREVTDIYNAPATMRVNGRLEVAADRSIASDVAVLNGPVIIAGTITGRLVAINADVTLKPGARIEGDMIVVGGVVEGRQEAYLGGELRIYRQVLYYREEGDRIVAERPRERVSDDRWAGFHRRYDVHAWSGLSLTSAHKYNRVEGLPIYFGPTFERVVGATRLNVEAYGVYRTADCCRWDKENLGHNVRGELRLGTPAGLSLGGHLYDVVDAVEPWQLSDAETGLATFFLHRDYRDYFNRHGASGSVGLFAGRDATLDFSFSHERWGSRRTLDPWTLFRNGATWRPNPEMNEGVMHLANATLKVDTRNDRDDPWSGWYVMADYERGTGSLSLNTALSPGVAALAPSPVSYGRGFLDLRRYNRISPDAQLNFRAVLGGWLHGDDLPGYDFRRVIGTTDVEMCSSGDATAFAARGSPALCQRMALLQAEYRGDLSVHLFANDGWPHRNWDHSAAWVLFADAGRGWLVGPRNGTLTYPKDQLPPFSTFRTDVGLGLDFDLFGVYVAKAVSESKQPANVFVRVRRRF